MSDLYVICDKDSNVLTIQGVDVLGTLVQLPAIFLFEDQALEVLYKAESLGKLAEPQHIRKMSGKLLPIS